MSFLTREYQTAARIRGPLIAVERMNDVAYEEIVTIVSGGGERQLGRVLEVSDEFALVQALGGTGGLSREEVRLRPHGRTLHMGVTPDMLGRVFDATGKPIDGGGPLNTGDERDINGAPLNPAARLFPSEFIQTGLSSVDGLNAMVRGQKLPIFSVSGLPHNELAAQIAAQATTLADDVPFAVVFAAIGMPQRQLSFYMNTFQASGALEHTALFVNQADEPSMKRLLTPRAALTTAEYLAFEHGMHVLVIMTDMTNYADALREVAAAREEIPGRRGYPAYTYSDFATLFERAGRVKGREGSVTQMPVLTMPDDDITHPIPDLTGYITEGQIVLSRDLHNKGIYPPVDVLPSLSRHMDGGVGEGSTRKDHNPLADQLYALYAEGQDVRRLSAIIGEEGLNEADQRVLDFANAFEGRFVGQGHTNRPIEETLELGWELLADFPPERLKRVSTELQEEYMP